MNWNGETHRETAYENWSEVAVAAGGRVDRAIPLGVEGLVDVTVAVVEWGGSLASTKKARRLDREHPRL